MFSRDDYFLTNLKCVRVGEFITVSLVDPSPGGPVIINFSGNPGQGIPRLNRVIVYFYILSRFRQVLLRGD
jgi:hypothetical protein